MNWWHRFLRDIRRFLLADLVEQEVVERTKESTEQQKVLEIQLEDKALTIQRLEQRVERLQASEIAKENAKLKQQVASLERNLRNIKNLHQLELEEAKRISLF